MGIFKTLAKIKADIFFIFLLLLISVWGTRNLFGGPYYTSHDGIHQVARLYHFKLALKDGVFPPRWANHAYYDFGYPLFHFNYHLPWYASLPLIFLRVDTFDVIKILHFAVYFLSGVFMYVFLKELVKNKWWAFFGAILYLVSPYRFVNIYVRNALGEVFALAFLPLVFYSILKLKNSLKIRHAVLLAVSLVEVILSHAMSFTLFSFSILLFAIYNYYSFSSKEMRKRFFSLLLISAAIFFCLVAYYLFPAFLEKRYTIFDVKFRNLYGRELLNLSQIIYSPWGYAGFGSEISPMSLQLGMANWIVVCASVLILIFIWKKKEKRDLKRLMIFLLAAFGLNMIFTLKVSTLFWKYLGRFLMIDFTWKFIGVAVFLTATLLATLGKTLNKKIGVILFIFLVPLMFYSNRNHIRVNKYTSFDIPSAVYFERGTNTDDEYLPKWQMANLGKDYFGKKENSSPDRIMVEAQKKEYKITNIHDKNQSFSYEYNGKAARHLIRKFYFPGWELYVNGKKTKFEYLGNGFFNFKVEKGKSFVEIKYEGTWLVKICNLISLVSWVVLCAAIPVIILKRRE